VAGADSPVHDEKKSYSEKAEREQECWRAGRGSAMMRMSGHLSLQIAEI